MTMTPSVFIALIPVGAFLAQMANGQQVHAVNIEAWLATGGTYGLIGALVYAVKYLAKRDEKSSAQLITALQSSLTVATKAATDTATANQALVTEINVMKARVDTLEVSMRGRCPFLGVHDAAGMTGDAHAIAQRLIAQGHEENHQQPHAG